jgi:hypothetical protein
MPTNHYRSSNINIWSGEDRLPPARFANELDSSSSFYFSYIWFVGSAHPTILQY